MNLSSIFPPSDLLERLRGVEAGLRQRKKLSGVGAALSVAMSALYVLVALEKDIGTWSALLRRTVNDPALLVIALGLFGAILATSSRYWLRTSREPFRYTCAIGTFDRIGPDGVRADLHPWMTWMPYDMTRLLNERVQRFYFSDGGAEPQTEAVGEEQPEAYVRVRAHWVIRKQPGGGADEIEVTPRVRLGPSSSPEIMAQATIFPLPANDDRAQYDELLERVYHSVVTEVYRQLKSDIRRKIALLPTTRHRAIALLHEADDYAHSNTLHAYEEAKQLYSEAVALCDPAWRPAVHGFVARRVHAIACRFHAVRVFLRAIQARYRPSAQDLELVVARAMTGYARMVVFTRVLRYLAGYAQTPAWDAAPVAKVAIERLLSLSRNARGHHDALFDAHVTRALAEWLRNDLKSAAAALRQARELDPRRTEADATFLLASGLLSPDRRTRLGLYRQAVERAPRSEVAQFCLAEEAEALWRRLPTLEKHVGDTVVAEYARVLKLNPGNLAACACAGYLRWLLGEHADARRFFELGLRYKATMRQDAFASKLDYGMARVAAEEGRLVNAYRHYVAAVAALSLSLRDEADYRRDFYWLASDAMEERYLAYREKVRHTIREVDPADAERSRMAQSLEAFIETDVGEMYLHRAGIEHYVFDEPRRTRAIEAFRRAIECNRALLLPYDSLARVTPGEGRKLLQRGLEFEPAWPAGRLIVAHCHADEIPDIPKMVRELALLQREREQIAPEAGTDYFKGQRLRQLNEEIATRQQELEAAPEKADEHRRKALTLVRGLLPHDWLWDGDEIALSALDDREINRRYRWERELTLNELSALWVWCRCYATDEARRRSAIRVLEHLRARFWPGVEAIAADLVEMKQQADGDDAGRKAAIMDEVLDATPAAATYLVLRGIEMTKELFCRADQDACNWSWDYRHMPAMQKLRADACQRLAERLSGTPEATTLYRRAAELSPSGDAHAALAEELEKRIGKGEAAGELLQEAIAAAETAVAREPDHAEYRKLLTRLQWTRQFGSAAAKLTKAPRPLEVHIGSEVVRLAQSIFQRAEQVREELFGTRYPPLHMTDTLASRSYRIYVCGTPRGSGVMPPDGTLDGLAADLRRVLCASMDQFLRLDGVYWIATGAVPGAGEALRKEGVLAEFGGVLRALAAEAVPLVPVVPVLRAFRREYAADRTLVEVAERVRCDPAILERLPALRGGADVAVVRAGDDFEAAVREAVNQAAGSPLDPKITAGLRSRVSASFASLSGRHRLLVCTPSARPAVARLVHDAVEGLIVASERHVAPGVLRSATPTAAGAPRQEERP